MPRKTLATAQQNADGEWQDGQPSQTETVESAIKAKKSAPKPASGENSSLPQTETGETQIPAELGGPVPGYSEDGSLSQTETELAELQENQKDLQEKSPVFQTAPDSDTFFVGEPSSSGQTHDNSDPDEGTNSSDTGSTDSDMAFSTAALQTETEKAGSLPGSEARAPSPPDITTDSQTDMENASQGTGTPRHRRVSSRSGETGENQESAQPARRRRVKSEPVLAIDEQRSVETQADKLRSDLLDLVESQKGRKILSDTIQGVERSADNPNISFAVIYHGAFKVIIPAEETVKPPEDFRDRSPADVMHYLVTKRLGAEIDYIVKGIDTQSGLAGASRLEAMALKRRQYYFGSDRDGNNLIYEGLVAEARVVSVIRAGMFVDLFGLETYIPLRELSYQRWIDAAAHFQPGQRVLVKILTLDRNSRDNIRVAASVKQAGENPYELALKRYTPGSRYVGTVSMVDTNGVFVSLDGGIDCLCSYPKRGRPPRGARVTVRVIGANHETNRIWGAITHMTTAR